MIYAVILAGGVGSRFWPLSRKARPKQFLPICSDRPIIEETINRIAPLIKKNNVFIATTKIHDRRIRDCLKSFDIPSDNFFFEPIGRNTLAPIAFFAHKIAAFHPQAVMAVMPSDHFIKDNKKYIRSLSQAIDIAKEGFIVTMGVKPTRPETGYGYIEAKSQCYQRKGVFYHQVDTFIEKPNLRKARRFMQDKRFFWNSGTFIFKAAVILEEIRTFMPKAYRIITKMRTHSDIEELWRRLPSISIDYAVMERTNRGVVLPVDYGWLDMGHWQALDEIMQKDKEGNIFIGEKCVDIGSKSALVWSDKRLIATIGLDNVIVVDTDDALLVCSKNKTQEVKKLVELLRKKNHKGAL